MQVKLWGVRGSIASPLSNEEYHAKIQAILEKAAQSLRDPADIDNFIEGLPENLRYIYGGNTTCATVQSDSGNLYIIDCGTGIRELGYELMKGPCGEGKGLVEIFLTHNHWDHIQGIPFFTPIYIPGNVLRFYSPYKDQEEYLKKQMMQPFFPASFEGTGSSKEFVFIDPKKRPTIKLEDDLEVDFFPLKHPGASFAYRFKQNGRTFIFATDAEFTGEILEQMGESTDSFFRDADLLVIDSQYTLDESFKKFDWGHTSYTMAVNCGIRWNVKTLILTHHEPAYPDYLLAGNQHEAIEHRNQSQHSVPEIFMAREGMTFDL